MHKLLCICVALATLVASDPSMSQCFPRAYYPQTYRDEKIVDEYFGVKVKDPYRWLENLDAPQTKKFIEEENTISRSYIDKTPVKREIKEELTAFWNFPKYSTPVKTGNKYFFFKNTGLQDQSVMYVQDTLDSEPRVFLDPSTLSADGSVSIANYEFSMDGSVFAYALYKKGYEWMTIRFKDVATGKDYPEILENLKFTKMAWTSDNKGFFYSRYPSEGANRNQKLYYHRLNSPQLEDIMVFEYPQEPSYNVFGVMSDDDKYLIVYVSKDRRFSNMVFYTDLSDVNGKNGKNMLFKPIISKLYSSFKYITNDGTSFMFRTNKDAPNFKLITIDIEKPEEKYWKEFIPEQEFDMLQFVYPVAKDKLFLQYVRDAKTKSQLHDLKTGEMLQAFNWGVGYVDGFYGKRWLDEVFFHFTSYFTPGLVYYLDFKKQPYKPVVLYKSEVKGFDPSLYQIQEVFYNSKDGTKIPMVILSKKNIVLDSANPVMLAAYGTYGSGAQPLFDVFYAVFMTNFNGVVAIPNLRGGGEWGTQWQAAGILSNKEKAVEDFVAAAEYLVAEKYSKPDLITAYGRKNGALIVAASINLRPNLFGAAIVRKGLLDMLRYHKFTTNSFLASEYGTSEDKDQFFNLMKYSPLHNIHTPVNHHYEYPATLVLTSDFNNMMHPAHSLKYIATLQNAVKDFRQYRPLLARIEPSDVRGFVQSTNKKIDRYTDILSFLWRALDLKYKNQA